MARTTVRTNPAAATAKWTARLQAAGAEMTAGANRVTVAPGQAAAAKFDKWLAGVQNNAAKWRRNVAAVSLEAWRSSYTTLGVNRAQAGATAKAGKYEAFANSFYPFLEQAMAKVNAMPDTTLEDRIAKSAAMQRALAQYKGGGGQAGVGASASG